MKKNLLSTLLVAGLIMIGLAPHTAHALSLTNTVEGFISYKGSPAVGVSVLVQCPDHNFATYVTTTNNGSFLTTVPTGKCPVGSHLRVSVGLDKAGSIIASRYGIDLTDVSETTNLNFMLFDHHPINVPEYGLVGGLAAAGIAAGGIIFTRRRSHRHHIKSS